MYRKQESHGHRYLARIKIFIMVQNNIFRCLCRDAHIASNFKNYGKETCQKCYSELQEIISEAKR